MGVVLRLVVYSVYRCGEKPGATQTTMLPILLVLLLATESVFGAATVGVTLQDIKETRPPNNPVAAINEIVDGGEKSMYHSLLENIVTDLSNQPDVTSRAIASAATIGTIGEVASGNSGDACAYANMVNAYVGYLGSGNAAGLRNALSGYVGQLNRAIDSIVALANNPGSLRYSSGTRGGCAGGGRSYQFEAAWESVLASANINNAGLLNELYCTSRRLYNAFNVRNNNLGAAASAAALGPVANVVAGALGAINNFFNAAAGGNAGAVAVAAANAKAALASSLANARF